ncbi:MAG: UDP-N-acetylglucosamine 2-epimerase [Desulfobacteraceae bacterium]|nr:UDP-N-acetylglucosamine 2-epimerase [Desulfobacteraceae bacterium]
MKRKICVITGTRAEYGLLQQVIQKIKEDPALELQIMATGMHLSPEFGLTFQEIEKDGFAINRKVEMLLSSDTPVGITKSMGIGMLGFADALQELAPDLIVVLGDRFEILAAVSSALAACIPVAHLHGDETTLGAFDEYIRHAVTKMSHLHLTSTEQYRKRVIQLGEHPERVFNVGAPGVENIKRMDLWDRKELEADLGLSSGERFFLATFHPDTLDKDPAVDQFSNLLSCLEEMAADSKMRIVFTKANADTGGRRINQMIDRFVADKPQKSIAFTSMGQIRYLSAMKYTSAVVGNSSSGIMEAPSFKVPTVNIGDRHKGRVRADSVIDCRPQKEKIQSALQKALSEDFVNKVKSVDNPYEKPETAAAIVEILRDADLSSIIKKEFYDI